MATNLVRQEAYQQSVICTDPTTPSSGDPIRYGNLTGVALTDEGANGNASTNTTVDFGPRVWNLGVDDSEDSAIAAGDALWYHDTKTGSPATNINNSSSGGYFFGFAQGAVSTSATTTIEVLHDPSAGAGTLATGGVGTTQLADSGVTAAKLSATLKTGFIPLPVTTWREVGTNDIQALAAHGGILAKDSTPILEFTNLDTDSAIRLNWAATDVNAIAIQTPLPPDLDVASNVELHMRAAMGGATDTPVIDADTFFNEGDTKVSDASAAITGTTVTEYTITVAAADVPAGAQTMSVELTPAAHGTDALHVYALWLEYTRA
jgi:predicted RecA/RadA family phage recombinase